MDKPTPSKTPSPPQPEPEKKRHPVLKGCLIAVGVVILLLVGLFIIGILGQEKEEEIIGGEEAKQEILGAKKYSVEETITLKNEGDENTSKIELTMVLIQDMEPYQKILLEDITPENYEIIGDDEGNKFAKFAFQNLAANAELEIKANYQVELNKIKNYLGPCQGETIESYLSPEDYLESDDPKIIDLASELTEGKANECEKALAIYNYIGDNMKYIIKREDRGALLALETKEGDCTCFSDLFIALARASGIPAKFIEGVTYKADVTENEKHSWLEAYLPGTGWTPIDATWGQNNRAKHFSQADGEHIIMVKGRNLLETEEREKPFHYFAYTWWGSTVTFEEDFKVTISD